MTATTTQSPVFSIPRSPSESGLQPLSPQLVRVHFEIADQIIDKWRSMIPVLFESQQTDRFFQQRIEYVLIIIEWISQLDSFIAFVQENEGSNLSDESISILAQAQRARRRLVEHRDKIHSRSTTLDEFELMLAEEMAIPYEQFAKIADRSPPPEEWLQRDEPRPW